MGLFDGYDFGPGGYSDRGGLIDRLLAGLQQQGQYAPSQGFAPMDANASMPQQASPIAVGDNYQMPRLGNTDLFQPQQASIPPNAQPTQGFAPPQPQAPLPSILQGPGNGLLDHLNAGFQNLAHSGGLLPGIVNAVSGFSTGQRLDPVGQQQEILRSQYQSLIPILGEQKARLAVLNPDIGKAMVAQALAGKQYTFVTTPDGTVIRQDAHAGTAEPVYQAGLKPEFGIISEEDGKKVYGWKDPSKRTVTPYEPASAGEDRGTVTGPDGKPIAIPPGVDRKTFVNEISKINADAAGGKMTEVQAKSSSFAGRMERAEADLSKIQNEGSSPWGRGLDNVPLVGGTAATNWAQSTNYQKYKQAASAFITAMLRQESGAAINKDEYTRYERELFPQVGDGPAVVAQKARQRAIALEQMKRAAGPGYKSSMTEQPTAAADPLGIR
jgi:hypothetical protein